MGRFSLSKKDFVIAREQHARQCALNRKLQLAAIFIKTGSVYLGFYTRWRRIVPKGRDSQSQIRSKAWFRSRDCRKRSFSTASNRPICCRWGDCFTAAACAVSDNCAKPCWYIEKANGHPLRPACEAAVRYRNQAWLKFYPLTASFWAPLDGFCI